MSEFQRYFKDRTHPLSRGEISVIRNELTRDLYSRAKLLEKARDRNQWLVMDQTVPAQGSTRIYAGVSAEYFRSGLFRSVPTEKMRKLALKLTTSAFNFPSWAKRWAWGIRRENPQQWGSNLPNPTKKYALECLILYVDLPNELSRRYLSIASTASTPVDGINYQIPREIFIRARPKLHAVGPKAFQVIKAISRW